MNTLNMQEIGIQELSHSEAQGIGGGAWPVVAFAVIGGIGAVYGGLYGVGFIAGVGVALIEKGLKN